MSKNIVLVGFMGAGKTVTAEVLASQLERKIMSTDAAIIEKEGRSINDIFDKDGEMHFRDVETQVVGELSQQENLVIDCGGGVVLREKNMAALKGGGVVVYLKTSPDVVYARVKDDTHRPLLNVEDPVKVIEDLLTKRAEFYAQADHEVLTDGKTAEEVAEEIVEIVSDI